SRFVKSTIAGEAHTQVLMIFVFEIAYPLRVVSSKLSGDCSAPVRGTIIHKYQFPIFISLLQYTFDCFANEPFLVEEDHNDRNQRVFHLLTSESFGNGRIVC